MAGQGNIYTKGLEWLLEPEDVGVRYLALRDLVDAPPDDPDLVSARREAHQRGPIATILERMEPEGYWPKAGAGYLPKYRSSVWSITLLAQLGAMANEDERIGRACGYLLEHVLMPGGQFTYNDVPSGTIDCLQGNLCWALVEMGVDDPRIDKAYEWMARSVTGEGIAPKSDKSAEIRYYAVKCGPNFACGANYNLPCAWGATKVMLALGRLPENRRTRLIDDAIRKGVEFLFSTDPAKADWPSGGADKPSGNWWKFGFPVFYVTDLLQVVEALVQLGFSNDARLANAVEIIRKKQDEKGRWTLDYDYAGKTWVEFGKKKLPNKWVTLRGMRMMREVG
ncbi:MAG: hypothetical protein A2136_06690 [Chloroflexi bacterium RBG_16_54_11]|nr:MAG: hypothetical protein A2136_06690 [Chloroflexi bacterium RBG_16_54_11]